MKYLLTVLISLVLLTSCSKEETPAAAVAEDIQVQVVATGADTSQLKSASNIVLVRLR